MSNSIQTAVMFIKAAGRYHTGDAVAPAAILWMDADGEWLPVATRLRALLLLTSRNLLLGLKYAKSPRCD